VTGILDRLEKQGLIRRRSDPRDARRLLLSLTAKGRSFDVDAEGTVEAAVQRALGRTPKRKMLAAQEVLGSIASSLESQPRPTRHHPRPKSPSLQGGRRK
jgi:DNA-binding MarR family transcriptional regulator